jgi:ParB family chromosome partitioning protein
MLLERGEERLLSAVEQGRIPVNAAVAIVGAGEDNQAMQAAMQEAYESGKLRGKQLLEMRRLLERRQAQGRKMGRTALSKKSSVTSSGLVRTYQREVDRQRLLVKKAEFTQQQLLFIASALRQLLSDEHFATLLRAEALDTLPTYLADRVWSGRNGQ